LGAFQATLDGVRGTGFESVKARALGQPDIEANVAVWQVEGARAGTMPAAQQWLSLAGA
jgi:hypothetical protein